MMKKLSLSLALLALACVADANTFTAEGTVFEPSHGYTFKGDRDLVPDGDFEEGTCLYGPTWICATTNTCDWIADLVPLGLWNFSGMHIAWFGGFCGGLATCSTTICKDIDFHISCIYITWYWMAYVNDAVIRFYITVDGYNVFNFDPQYSDHLLDYRFASTTQVNLGSAGIHELCLGMDNPACDANLGDNYFVDYVEWWWGGTAAQDASFSAVKSLY